METGNVNLEVVRPLTNRCRHEYDKSFSELFRKMPFGQTLRLHANKLSLEE